MVRPETIPNLNPNPNLARNPTHDPLPSHKPRRRLSQKFRGADSYVQLFAKSTPIVPHPKVLASYKPPPLTAYSAEHRPLAPQIPLGNRFAERQITAGETTRKSLETAIARLANELEAHLRDSKRKSDCLRAHNYAFNELILMEKSTSSDKALLLRRLHGFYNHVLSALPSLSTKFESEKSDLINQIEALVQKTEELAQQRDKQQTSTDQAVATVAELESELADAMDERRRKEGAIAATNQELEFARGQGQRLTFRIAAKKEKRAALRRAIADRHAEFDRQSQQILTLDKELQGYEKGETGYVVKYRDEIERGKGLAAALAQVQAEMEVFMSIEKADIAVDTSDLPKKPLKGTKKKPIRAMPHLHPLAPTLPKPAAPLPPAEPAPLPEPESSGQPDFYEVECQTDEVPPPAPRQIEKVVIKEVQVEVASASQRPLPWKQDALLEEMMDSQNPQNVHLDYQKLAALPDLHAAVMPLMSVPFEGPAPAEPRTFTLASALQAGHRRPILWVLQFIHSFFCDPKMHSIEATAKRSCEAAFHDWLSGQLKIQHLVVQAVMNISYALHEHKTDHTIIGLLEAILEGQFSLPQICFIAILYANSCGLCQPNLADLMVRMDVDPHDLEAKIHVGAAQDRKSVV
jgi:hypothetical protein